MKRSLILLFLILSLCVAEQKWFKVRTPTHLTHLSARTFFKPTRSQVQIQQQSIPQQSHNSIPFFAKPIQQQSAKEFRVIPSQLLIATDQLDTSYHFKQTVILTVSHKSNEPTIGFILNRPLRPIITLESFVRKLQIVANSEIVIPDSFEGKIDTYIGGPVVQNHYYALFQLTKQGIDSPNLRSFISPVDSEVNNDIFYTTFPDDFIELALQNETQHLTTHWWKVFVSISSWMPGQLENEIKSGAWKILSPDSKLITSLNDEEIWEHLQKLESTTSPI